MKKTHELKNGTVLEEGGKYTSPYWGKHEHITVLSLGGNTFYYKTFEDKENVKTYGYAFTNWELIPYTEPDTIYQWALKHKDGRWFIFDAFVNEDYFKDAQDIEILQKLKAFQEINGKLVEVKLKED